MSRFIPAGVVAACVVVGTACASDHTTDSLETVKKNLADGKAVLLDVREESEWKAGRLKDAKHLALSELKKGVASEKLKQTLPPGKIVYLHCGSGVRCLNAGDLLKKQGYDVRPLKDGYQDLLEAGFEKAK